MPGPLLVWPFWKLEYLLEHMQDLATRETKRTPPQFPAFLWPRGPEKPNLLNDMIILVDEAHKLFDQDQLVPKHVDWWGPDPKKAIVTRFTYQHLRTALQTADNSKIVYATATLPTDQTAYNQMRALVTQNDQATTYDGHLHAYTASVQEESLFPTVVGVSEILTNVPVTEKSFPIAKCTPDIGRPDDERDRWSLTCYHSFLQHNNDGMFDTLEKNMEHMAPKIFRLLADRKTYLSKNSPAPAQGVLVLCDKYSGLQFLLHYLKKKLSENTSQSNFVFLDGKKGTLRAYWYGKGGTPSPKVTNTGFASHWQTQRQHYPTVVVDLAHLAEGLDLPGIGIVLCCASFRDGSTMEQAFGRADRMCSLPKTNNTLERRLYLMDGGTHEPLTKAALQQWVAKAQRDQNLQNESF